MANVKTKTQKLVILAMLTAIIAVISFMPLKTMGLEITLSMIPVAVGAALYGPTTGAVLGGVFGIVSFLQCLGYSPFGAMLLAINPFLTFLVCVPTRILAGYLAGLVAAVSKKAFKKDKSYWTAHTLGAVIAPILNTVFFMSVLCLCFYNTELIQGFKTTLGAQNVLHFIVLFVGINGLVEILAGIFLALPITKALAKIAK